MIMVSIIKNCVLSSVLGNTKDVILIVKLCPVVCAVNVPPVSICPFEDFLRLKRRLSLYCSGQA